MYYAKKISGHFMKGKSEEALKMISEFWNSNMRNVKGLKGFILMLDPQSPDRATNVTVWENKEYMDEYYSDNESYSLILETVQQIMVGELERQEYIVLDFKCDLNS